MLEIVKAAIFMDIPFFCPEKKMEDLISNLEQLGFSKIEAQVYSCLVQHDIMSGYSIAKKLNKTRPSVYNALDNLLEKGFVNIVHGETVSEYVAVDPELLLNDISIRVSVAAKKAREKLVQLKAKSKIPRFENIEGKSNLVSAVNRLIANSKKEIVMNSSMPLAYFKDSLMAAAKRKVRIILFTWQNLDTLGIPMEFYSGFDGTDDCTEERIFLVSDLTNCVIGSNDSSGYFPHKKVGEKRPNGETDFMGMTSSNRLIVNMVTEHIHFDIYLNKMKKKSRKNLFTPDILLGSLMETGL